MQDLDEFYAMQERDARSLAMVYVVCASLGISEVDADRLIEQARGEVLKWIWEAEANNTGDGL